MLWPLEDEPSFLISTGIRGVKFNNVVETKKKCTKNSKNYFRAGGWSLDVFHVIWVEYEC